MKFLKSFSRFNVSSSFSRERTGSSLVKTLSKFLTSVLDCCEENQQNRIDDKDKRKIFRLKSSDF